MTQGYTPDGYVLTMAYDAENRMKLAEYDAKGIRHRTDYIWGGDSLLVEEKKYQNGALTQDTRYVRAGFLPVQERDAANVITREYTWGLNLGGGIGGLLNLRYGGQDYSYLYDGKGNVTAIIDGTQSVAAAYSYDPFGILIKKRGTLDQRYMFSTKEYDAGTGLNYYGYRFYMPALAKWTTPDPLEEAGGVNLYGFVGNNPVNVIDPFGLIGLFGPGFRNIKPTDVYDDSKDPIPPVKCRLIPGQFSTMGLYSGFEAARLLGQGLVSPIGNMLRYRTPVIINPNLPIGPSNAEAAPSGPKPSK